MNHYADLLTGKEEYLPFDIYEGGAILDYYLGKIDKRNRSGDWLALVKVKRLVDLMSAYLRLRNEKIKDLKLNELRLVKENIVLKDKVEKLEQQIQGQKEFINQL